VRYIYDVYDENSKAVATAVNFNEAIKDSHKNGKFIEGYYINVIDLIDKRFIKTLRNHNEVDGWFEGVERANTWKPFEEAGIIMKRTNDDPINPKHYKDYCQGLEWLETMQYLPRYQNPENFIAALELQIRKYLDRANKKGIELEQLEKAQWYLKFIIKYIKNGNKPIRIKD